jgi:hypothetical protein
MTRTRSHREDKRRRRQAQQETGCSGPTRAATMINVQRKSVPLVLASKLTPHQLRPNAPITSIPMAGVVGNVTYQPVNQR